MYIYTPYQNFEENLRSQIGGKAYNLNKISNLLTPKWFVLTVSFFDKLMGNKKLEISNLLKKPTEENLKNIQDIILNLNFEESLKFEVLKRISSNKRYAVRSSCVDEDSLEVSFAGIMESYLNVNKPDIFDYIKKCYLSAFTSRAIEYRKINNLSTVNINMAVIIQEMIDAEISGVINSINPITNNPDEIVISVVEGLGEDLVSGKLNSTDYFINGNEISINGENLLSKKLIKKLVLMTHKISLVSDTFQDIEFCIKKGKVYFLQTRPIATYANINSKKKKTVLDNANIIESYSGVTTPLTFSFAKEVYHKVYTATLNAGKINKKIMDTLYPSLSNMLYFYDNKVYYNLNSWYHVNSIFPNKKANNYMERMMGVNTKLTNTKSVSLNIFQIIKFGFSFLKRLNKMDDDSNKFILKFNEVVMPFVGANFNNLENNELLKLYKSLENGILNDFSTPIINDCGAMMYYGMLTKFVNKIKNIDHEGYISYLVGRQGNVESAMSAPLFLEIVEDIRRYENIKIDFINLDANALYKKYHFNSEVSLKVSEYLKMFGPRVMDELKLETITLLENPLFLYDMLKNYIINDIKTETFDNYNKAFNVSIPLLKRPYFNYLVKKTKYFIRNRERLRLKRTYIYSVVRRIFIQIGNNFYKSNIIEDARDIFFITKNEIFNIIDGKIISNLKELIQERKDEFQSNKTHETFNRIVFYGEEILPIYTKSEIDNNALLSGIPSGVGIVNGKIKYVENPKDALLNDEILLALRTDPGWITLYPMCKGLIVERGSILSHSAVVAREMGIPAVVGVSGATKKLKTGMIVELDGIKGEIRICE